MTPPPAAESGCQLMRRLAKEQEKSIEKSEEHAEELRKRITEMKAQPNPDQAQISALKQALEHLEKKIGEDRVSLADLESVISENC